MRIKESVWVYLCTCFVLMFKSIKKKPVTLWIVVTSFFFCGDLTPGRAVPCSWHFGFMSQIFSPANRCLVNESPETFLPEISRKNAETMFLTSTFQHAPWWWNAGFDMTASNMDDVIVKFLIFRLKRFCLSEWENTSSSILIVRNAHNHLSAAASSGHNLQLKLKSTFSAVLTSVCDMHHVPVVYKNITATTSTLRINKMTEIQIFWSQRC